MRKLIAAALFNYAIMAGSYAVSYSKVAAPLVSDRAPQSGARLPLKPCRVPGIEGEVLCGTYEVYENRGTKKGRKIPLNIVVLPALKPNPAPEPLFALAGGPGQAATAGAANDAQRFAAIRRDRDIVLVDQRGTGRSNRLDCALEDANEVIRVFVAGGLPIDQVKQCREELGKRADLRLYTTPIAMDDLEEVRGWLGYEQINLYGGSYGTRAALVYLKHHPMRVRTVTLRAVSSTSERNPLYNPRDSQQALNRLYTDCAEDKSCAEAFPTLSQDFQSVLVRLAQSPAKVSVQDPRANRTAEVIITRDVFAGIIRRLLYDSGSQRLIPLIINSAVNNDYKPLAQVFSQTLGLVDSLSLGMNLSVNCTEDVAFIKQNDILRETKGTFVGAMIVQGIVNACKAWPRGRLPAAYHSPVKSNTPVLIFSGTLDPQSPPARGAEVAQHLPNSFHIVMEGIAHGPFPNCALNIMSEFISKASTAGLDLSCAKELRRPQFAIPPRRKAP